MEEEEGNVCKTFINEMLYVKLIIQMIGGTKASSSAASDSSSPILPSTPRFPGYLPLPQQDHDLLLRRGPVRLL